jgi:hypothetical protein
MPSLPASVMVQATHSRVLWTTVPVIRLRLRIPPQAQPCLFACRHPSKGVLILVDVTHATGFGTTTTGPGDGDAGTGDAVVTSGPAGLRRNP